MRNRFMTMLALSLTLAACAEDGKDGENGTNGADGTNGEDGVDGVDGVDGTNGICADAEPVEITGLTGLPEAPIYIGFDSDSVTVESNAAGALSYSVAGYGIDYTWDGDSFTMNATTAEPSSQVIIATDGCTTATYEFSVEAETPISYLNFIHLFDGAPVVDVTFAGAASADEAVFFDFTIGDDTGYLSAVSDTYEFDVWVDDAYVATLPAFDAMPDVAYSVVVYSDGGAPNAMVIEDDITEVATADASRIRATHAADGVGQVDIWETVSGTALFEDLDFAATSAGVDAVTGEYTFGIDADDDGVADYNFETIDTTGLEGYPVNAYAYLDNGLPLVHVSIPAAGASTTIFPTVSTTLSDTSSPAAAIDGSADVIDTISFTETCLVLDLNVTMDISHVWRGDIEMSLTAPDGTIVELHDNTGGSADDIIGNYAMDGSGSLTAEGDLEDFFLTSATGDWTLTITDTYPWADDGTLNSWTLDVGCP